MMMPTFSFCLRQRAQASETLPGAGSGPEGMMVLAWALRFDGGCCGTEVSLSTGCDLGTTHDIAC